MKTLVLSATDILAAHSAKGLKKAMEHALKNLSSAQAQNFPRTVIEFNSSSALGVMPAQDQSRNLLGYKAVSVFFANRQIGLNPHQGLVILMDEHTGLIKALLDGTTVTALRTAAVSAAATERLSKQDAKTLTLIGAGRQAYEHALAIYEVRPIQKIQIWNRTIQTAENLILKLKNKISCEFSISDSPQQAVRNADIVVTCTSSKIPILRGDDFMPGTHINAVGSCRPGFSEIDLRSQKNFKIFADSRLACAQEAHELDSLSIEGEIGELLHKQISGRSTMQDITLFKSVGLGIEDLFAADFYYQQAQYLNLGVSLELGDNNG